MTATLDANHIFETEFVPVLPKLRAHALRLCNQNIDNAEDLLQTSLLRIVKYMHSYTPGTSPTNFGMRVVSNEFLRRDRKEITHVYYDDIPEHLHPTGDEFEGMSQELQDALKTLPADMATVIYLTAVLDLTNAEVAQRMGVQVGTVSSRKQRAKERLRDALTGLPPVIIPVEPSDPVPDS